ncbi:hypothetical protein [Ralstonia pseudosolanacearum]|uniref:hypothetical protein n=1 Tax=Ralstonia pseudosolanacearum TaxID=1310165 RepID=UPI0008F892D5|nr:hypothetical protein [Ralstonia pseudosolanacearum]AVV67535.1 hypothetical protein RSOE_03460 [Ralstonia solanacearum OE1-1]AXW40706.1 hypothetical protein CJO89_21040 [Ralstonia solanacearum]API77329.1 hypothetical protein AC251_22450 [Ralstonia pseudosolanacearum]AXW73502.1 hypothetical protein CJO96_20375 [Ralstonia solanacearum]MCK4153030.1 hypothetical protein [Ralstonia pseudosolanacearum]
MRIKPLRIHIPLLHLLSFVVVAAFFALGFDSHVNPIVCVVGGCGHADWLDIRDCRAISTEKRTIALSHFLGFFLLLPIALFAESVILSAIGLSAMKGLLY